MASPSKVTISPFYIAHDNQRFGACKLFNSHLAKWIPNLLINICQEGEKFRQLVPARNKGCPLFWSCGCKMPLFRPLARPDHLLFRWLPRANFHSYLALLFFSFSFLQSWVQHNDSPLPIGTFLSWASISEIKRFSKVTQNARIQWAKNINEKRLLLANDCTQDRFILWGTPIIKILLNCRSHPELGRRASGFSWMAPYHFPFPCIIKVSGAGPAGMIDPPLWWKIWTFPPRAPTILRDHR